MNYQIQGFTMAAILLGTASPILANSAISQISQMQFQAAPIQLVQSDAEFNLEDPAFWTAQCLLLDGEQQYSAALISCEKAISLEPRKENVALWAARGSALFHTGRYAESLISYDRVVESEPKYSWAIAYQCANQFQLQRYADAIDTCEQSLRIDGNWGNVSPAFAWYYRGLALRKIGRLETALASFDRALRINPDDSQATAERCGILAELDHPNAANECGSQTAVDAYDRALATNPNDAALWLQQGLASEQLGAQPGAYQRALTAYSRAVELNPKSSLALARRCGVLNQLENYQAALESCEQAFQGDGNWGESGLIYGWNQQSIALAGLGKPEEALAAADRAIAIDVNYAPAWNSRAVMLWQLGQNQAAIEQTKIAIDLYQEKIAKLPQETFERTSADSLIVLYRGQILALFNQGRIFASLGEDQSAAKSYWQALEIYGRIPNGSKGTIRAALIADLYANRAAAYLRLDDYQVAKVSAEESVTLDPTSFAGWYNRGLACTRLGEYLCAFEAYDYANRLSPNNIYVMVARGMALEQSGDRQGAMAVYEQALNIDPGYALAQQRYNYLTQLANPEQK